MEPGWSCQAGPRDHGTGAVSCLDSSVHSPSSVMAPASRPGPPALPSRESRPRAGVGPVPRSLRVRLCRVSGVAHVSHETCLCDATLMSEQLYALKMNFLTRTQSSHRVSCHSPRRPLSQRDACILAHYCAMTDVGHRHASADCGIPPSDSSHIPNRHKRTTHRTHPQNGTRNTGACARLLVISTHTSQNRTVTRSEASWLGAVP